MRFVATAWSLTALLVTTAAAADYFAGTWKEDLTKSTNSWGEKPTVARTRTYTPTSTGGYEVRIEGVDPQGKPLTTTLQAGGNTEMTMAPSRSKGVQMMEPTHVISRRVDDRTMVATYRKNGKDVGTSTSKISSDGHTLTMTLEGTAANGTKVKALSVYRK